MPVSPIPPGFHTITAQLALEDCAKAIEFYKRAFGAELLEEAPDPTGKKIWHASLRIGDSILFVNDVFPDMGGSVSNSNLWLYVPDADAAFKRAVDAGAKSTMPVTDMFWGDRTGQVVDPFGQRWTFATRKKELTPEQMKAAAEAFIKNMPKR